MSVCVCVLNLLRRFISLLYKKKKITTTDLADLNSFKSAQRVRGNLFGYEIFSCLELLVLFSWMYAAR